MLQDDGAYHLSHIMEYSQRNHILTITNQQHGYSHDFSCQTELITLMEDLLYDMDNHCQVTLIYLSFVKVFI